MNLGATASLSSGRWLAAVCRTKEWGGAAGWRRSLGAQRGSSCNRNRNGEESADRREIQDAESTDLVISGLWKGKLAPDFKPGVAALGRHRMPKESTPGERKEPVQPWTRELRVPQVWAEKVHRHHHVRDLELSLVLGKRSDSEHISMQARAKTQSGLRLPGRVCPVGIYAALGDTKGTQALRENLGREEKVRVMTRKLRKQSLPQSQQYQMWDS